MRSSFADQPAPSVMGAQDAASSIACPSCGSDASRSLGRIPDAVEFAGRRLDSPLAGGTLHECGGCALRFRLPQPPKAFLDRLYAAGAGDAWATATEHRVDWALARDVLARESNGGRVLDLGCHDGRFLLALPERWTREGIELNPAAAARAVSAGIAMVGTDFAALGELEGRYDAITAFDVIEHVGHCAALLSTAARALRPGGVLVIATGNADAFPLRLLGARHLYVICAEHLAFVGPRWCRAAAPNAGLEVESFHPYRRAEGSAVRIVSDLLKSLAYRASPALFAMLRGSGVGNLTDAAKLAYPPLWPTARDHFLAVFRRKA